MVGGMGPTGVRQRQMDGSYADAGERRDERRDALAAAQFNSAWQCSAVLSSAQCCSVMLSGARQCSAVLSRAL